MVRRICQTTWEPICDADVRADPGVSGGVRYLLRTKRFCDVVVEVRGDMCARFVPDAAVNKGSQRAAIEGQKTGQCQRVHGGAGDGNRTRAVSLRTQLVEWRGVCVAA